MTPQVIVTETMVTPTGMDPLADPSEASIFGVFVRWQGERGWTVTRNFKDDRLSVKGRKWTGWVEKRNRRFYYFSDYETALQAAKEAVDEVTVNGGTWEQWQQHHERNQK